MSITARMGLKIVRGLDLCYTQPPGIVEKSGGDAMRPLAFPAGENAPQTCGRMDHGTRCTKLQATGIPRKDGVR
jgi:hypothetical protein